MMNQGVFWLFPGLLLVPAGSSILLGIVLDIFQPGARKSQE
jgi:hypothetical protein